MGHLTTSMSGEQEARTEFVAAAVPLRERLEDLDGAVASFDALVSAVVDFGTCELRIRRAERVSRASPDSAEATELRASAMRHHERGLRAMQQARAVVLVLAAMEPEPGALATWRQASADVRAEWREQVRELDVGGSDADHLLRIMDECCDALDDNGPASLAGHLAVAIGRPRERTSRGRSRDQGGVVPVVEDRRCCRDPRHDRLRSLGRDHEQGAVVGVLPHRPSGVHHAALRRTRLLTGGAEFWLLMVLAFGCIPTRVSGCVAARICSWRC